MKFLKPSALKNIAKSIKIDSSNNNFNKYIHLNLLTLIIIGLIGSLNYAFVAPGDLDPTFGINGRVLTDI